MRRAVSASAAALILATSPMGTGVGPVVEDAWTVQVLQPPAAPRHVPVSDWMAQGKLARPVRAHSWLKCWTAEPAPATFLEREVMEPIAHVGVVQAAASVDGGMAVRGAGGGGGGDEMGAEAMTMAVVV